LDLNVMTSSHLMESSHLGFWSAVVSPKWAILGVSMVIVARRARVYYITTPIVFPLIR
jgi:hypothetical protein